MKRSFTFMAMIACAAIAANGADTLEEAFKNGKASGDVSAYYESRHVDKGDKSTYFNNTAWAIGSVGLKYETDFYKSFKGVVGFRGSVPFYEDDKDFDTGHGKGDSTERIYENNRFMLSNLYLEYNAYDTVVRVGRQNMNSDWVTKVNDGVSVTNNSVSNLTLDALWTRARGKVQLNEMFRVKKINKNKGLFAGGATYKFDNGLAFRGYVMHASDVFTGYGAKAMYDGSITDDFGMGGIIHVARTSEKHADDGKLFDTSVYAKYQDHKFTVGYTQTGKKNGWGSFNKAGDNIVQFEEGDVMYERDVRTVYTMVSTKVEKLSIDAILGTTSYKLKGGDEKRYRQHEFSAWLSYPILENLSAIVKFDKTIKAQPYYPAMTQVSAGLSYTF